MAGMYGRRIKKGEITIDQVPTRWRAATIEWLQLHAD